MAVVIPDRGKFRHVIKLENVIKSADGAGGQNESYQPFCTTRGFMEKRSGFRNLEEGYDQLVSEWRGFIAWRNSFDAYIRKDTRWIYDNRVFKIVNKEVVDQKRMVYMFTLIEVE